MIKNKSDRRLKMIMKRWGKIFITFEINHAKRMADLTGRHYPFPYKEITNLKKVFFDL